MKINVLSDLHLEFPEAEFHPGHGEVLILAGDICTAESFVMRSDRKLKERFSKFFDECVENYDKVFYVMGNHEHYNFFYDLTEQTLRDNLPEGITLLHNQSELYKGVHFVGSTMWTNFNNSTDAMSLSSRSMNDYHCIYHKQNMSKLDPKEIAKDHDYTVEWFNQCIPMLKGPVVMITHHAPSEQSFRCGYREEEIKPAYVANMEEFIKKNDNIRLWVHGHIHESNDYSIGRCRVYSNPRGYSGYQLNEDFHSDQQLFILNNTKPAVV